MTSENDEFEDEEEETIIFADRGLYNPFWILKAAMVRANYAMLWNAVGGLVLYLEEEGFHGHYHADEILDVMYQNMFTATYVDPFDHSDEPEDETPITETDIEDFMKKLDLGAEGLYAQDNDDEKETD